MSRSLDDYIGSHCALARGEVMTMTRFLRISFALLFGLTTATQLFAAGCSGSSDDSSESSASANFTEDNSLKGDVRMILDISGAQATYEKNAEGGYKQTKATRTVNQKIVGSGFLVSLSK